MARGEISRVVLGAGKWYLAEWTGGTIDLDAVAAEENFLGCTRGGATISYKPELHSIEDDTGLVRRTFMTCASAEMKTGLLTFNMQSVHALMSVGQLTQSAGKRVLKLGGGRSVLRRFCVAFVYEDADTGCRIRIGMVATNTSPLEFAFAKDEETVLEVTFKAESNGVDDTIVVIEEDVAQV
ncbi:MAG: hypothetical protein U0L09_09510 [Christensenellales bacterium]|nr:hypothetical protein [Christensenellales bacterium]